ncbi:MAG: hypothetical protein WD768_10975 [Phycisphaeraceae bacterium]
MTESPDLNAPPAALRLKKEDRLYSPIFAWCGLFACLFLAFSVD